MKLLKWMKEPKKIKKPNKKTDLEKAELVAKSYNKPKNFS